MKDSKPVCQSDKCIRSYAESDLPSHLAWNIEATTLEERYRSYEKIFIRVVGRDPEDGLHTIHLRNRDHSSFVKEDEQAGSHHSWCDKDPLKPLRIQQPHLSTEIDAFYFKFCRFVIGTIDTTDNILAALRWCHQNRPDDLSHLQQLQVHTTPERLETDSTDLVQILHWVARCKGLEGFTCLDFCVKQRKTSSTSVVTISGVVGFSLQLLVGSKSRLPIQNVTQLIGKAFQPQWNICVRNEEGQGRYTIWLFSQAARRANFMERLPLEMRRLILVEAGQDFDEYTASSARQWSEKFHCHRNRLVSSQFVTESRTAFYTTHPFEFQIHGEGHYEIIHGFLKLAGDDVLRTVAAMTFITKWVEYKQWHREFSWLVNTLNAFSVEPDCSRNIHSLEIESLKVCLDSNPPHPTDYSGSYGDILNIDLEELCESYSGLPDYRVAIRITASIKIELVNLTLKVSARTHPVPASS